MTDRIEVSGIEVWGKHGVLPSEKASGQTFIVDLVLYLDTSAPADTDDLSKTADYGVVAGRVHDLVASTRFNLIERVAEEIASAVLEDLVVERVEVTVHKPNAPIEVPFRDVSVTIERGR